MTSDFIKYGSQSFQQIEEMVDASSYHIYVGSMTLLRYESKLSVRDLQWLRSSKDSDREQSQVFDFYNGRSLREIDICSERWDCLISRCELYDHFISRSGLQSTQIINHFLI